MMRSKLTAAILFLAGASAFAQSNQGTITGTISDPAGAVVPAAAIQVKNAETGVVYQGGTSNTGNYVIPVPSGKYEMTNFEKLIIDDRIVASKPADSELYQLITSTKDRRMPPKKDNLAPLKKDSTSVGSSLPRNSRFSLRSSASPVIRHSNVRPLATSVSNLRA